jgi:8-oxo-dGTP pyrophosphatase MutT (NUDIX family)
VRLKRATRVSGILVTPSGPLLVIRRERPGVSVYRILPGGSIEPGDGDLEATVRREMREETGATPTDLRLVAALEESEDYAEPRLDHHFLARIEGWSEDQRTAPELTAPGPGGYFLEDLDLDA